MNNWVRFLALTTIKNNRSSVIQSIRKYLSPSLFLLTLILAILVITGSPQAVFSSVVLKTVNWNFSLSNHRSGWRNITLSSGWKIVPADELPESIRQYINTSDIPLSFKEGMWLRNRFELHENTGPVSIKFPSTFLPFLLWINNIPILTNLPSKTVPNRYHAYPLYPLDSSHQIADIIIFFFQQPVFGASPWNDIRIGHRDGMRISREISLIMESSLAGIFIFAFAFNFLLAFLLKKPVRFGGGLLSLLCGVAFLFTFLTGATMEVFYFIPRSFLVRTIFFLQNMTITVMIIFLRLFLSSRQRFGVSSLPILSVIIAVSILGFFIPYHTLFYFQAILYILLICALVIQSFLSSGKPEIVPDNRLLRVSASMIFIFSSVFDFIYYLKYLQINTMIPFGAALFCIIYSYLIAMRAILEVNASYFLKEQIRLLKKENEALQEHKFLTLTKEQSVARLRQIFETKKAEFFSVFTTREKEIIQHLVNGDSYKEISTKLFISEKTVDNHTQNIYRKAGVNGRGSLIRLFRSLSDFANSAHP